MEETGRLVERFYGELWTRAEETVADGILTADFRVRGSPGPEPTGRAGFPDHLREVPAALGDYRCVIRTLIEAGPRAAALGAAGDSLGVAIALGSRGQPGRMQCPKRCPN